MLSTAFRQHFAVLCQLCYASPQMECLPRQGELLLCICAHPPLDMLKYRVEAEKYHHPQAQPLPKILSFDCISSLSTIPHNWVTLSFPLPSDVLPGFNLTAGALCNSFDLFLPIWHIFFVVKSCISLLVGYLQYFWSVQQNGTWFNCSLWGDSLLVIQSIFLLIREDESVLNILSSHAIDFSVVFFLPILFSPTEFCGLFFISTNHLQTC